MEHRVQELRRKHEVEQQHIKDQVDSLWREKLIEKDNQIKSVESDFEAKRAQLNEDITVKDYQFKDLTEKYNDIKAKLISLQAKNDDLENQLTIGKLDQDSTIEKQKLKIDSLQNELNAVRQAHSDEVVNVSGKVEQRVTKQLQERFEYETKAITDRHKLEIERAESNSKFQLRQSDDRQRDLERENYNLKGRLDSLNSKVAKLELNMDTEYR